MKTLFTFFSMILLAASSYGLNEPVCDSVHINKISYNDSSNTYSIVVSNASQKEVFPYPSFYLLNNSGDTVAKHDVFTYGIPHNDYSYDMVSFQASGIDKGTLFLNTYFDDSVRCSFPVTVEKSIAKPTLCDSLSIDLVHYNDTTNNYLVTAHNLSQTENFAAPSFVLLDEQKDTIAMEDVNYYAIWEYHQKHELSLIKDTVIRQGELLLFKGFYDTLMCKYPVLIEPETKKQDTICEAVIIKSVTHQEATNTYEVAVENSSWFEYFPYPNFTLYNSQGDTVALERVNYYGIGHNEQIHDLNILSDETIANGTLTLSTLFSEQTPCSFNINVENVLSFNQDRHTKLAVYPNPTQGIVHLPAYTDFEVLNTQGVLLLKGTGETLDLSNFEKGVYIIQSSYFTTRVVKD